MILAGFFATAFTGCGMGYYGQGGCGLNAMRGHVNDSSYRSNLSSYEIKHLNLQADISILQENYHL